MTARARRQRLYVNVDHVATLRQARRGEEPDVVAAARACEDAGADGITIHLREDRRHIQDADLDALRRSVRTYLNLELACVPEMVEIAVAARPQQVTLVPERREEITTEGGLDVRGAGIRTSLFVDPDPDAVRASSDIGAEAIELHTGRYAHAPGEESPALEELRRAASLAAKAGLAVHAGHGLTAANVRAVAAIAEIEELNIGHSIVSRALFVGLPAAIREVREAMDAARGLVLSLPAP